MRVDSNIPKVMDKSKWLSPKARRSRAVGQEVLEAARLAVERMGKGVCVSQRGIAEFR